MADLFEQYQVWSAIWMTIKLTLAGAVGSLVLGTIIAILRMSPVPMLRFLGTAYVNIFRNTPLTLIILSTNLVLWAKLGVKLADDKSPDYFATNNFRLAVLGLVIYHASYVCEALRSGVNTIPLGQAEAARSIGLGFLPAARHVILPQALRGAITPLGNTVIALTKNTTVAAAASVAEASGLMKRMIEFSPDVMVAIFLTFAIGFCLIVIPIGLLTTWASEKWAVAR